MFPLLLEEQQSQLQMNIVVDNIAADNGNEKRYENCDVSYVYVRNYVMENPKNMPVPAYFCTGQDQVFAKMCHCNGYITVQRPTFGSARVLK